MKRWAISAPVLSRISVLFVAAFCVTAIIGIGALAVQAAQAPAESRQALLTADHAFAQAAANGDSKAAASLLASQFTWTDRKGKTWTRSQTLVAWKTLASTVGKETATDAKVYGRVGLVAGEAQRGDHHVRFGRIWLKQGPNWKLMVYQANAILPAQPASASGASEKIPPCINPCKEVPYSPKTATARAVVVSWQELETANVTHSADVWARHVSDDFELITPEGQVLTKADRVAQIHQQAEHASPRFVPPAQWVHVQVYGDTALMTARHHLLNGTPYRAVRIWVLHDGVWQLAYSQQTVIK